MPSQRASERPGSLERYHKKRDFERTPEPSGRKGKPRAASGGKLRFVVQMHRATRLHYDFRLEADGVMASWAVPKGPTLVAGDRRLAMHVEDHPIEYTSSKGTFPKGNTAPATSSFGIEGRMRWPRATIRRQRSRPARSSSCCAGKKLRGEFTLVKIKAREDEHGDPWLLIKDRDEHVDPKYDPADHPESVVSGKTLDDVAEDPRAKTWHSKPKARHAATPARKPVKRDPMPHPKSLMLATLIGEAFDDPDWLFEIKWDGYRALCTVDDKGRAHARLPQRPRSARALSRSGRTRDRVLERARDGGRRDRQPR